MKSNFRNHWMKLLAGLKDRLPAFILLSSLPMVTCSFSRRSFPVEKGVQGFFPVSYPEARKEFRRLAGKKIKQIGRGNLTSIKIPAQNDNDLTIDILYIPPAQKTNQLLVLTSGVHGLEGFTGSAMQCLFMTEYLSELNKSNTGVLLIHAVNPWGFKFYRRVTENNIDLNRNASVSDNLYNGKNKGYRELNSFLNPEGKANPGSIGNRFFFPRAVWRILINGMSTLRQAILQGQYEYPSGLYFGGKDQEPQILELATLFEKRFAPYESIYEINFHTGYGEQGKLHFFPNPEKDPERKKQIEDLYRGFQIDWGDSEDFYTTTGEFGDFICSIAGEKTCIPMVFEYGTMDSQTTGGSVRSIHNMILENQGHHHGYEDPEDSQEIRQRILEMYYPADKGWRSEISRQTRRVLDSILPKISQPGK